MKFDYTATARRWYLKHPLLSEIGIQINFWIVAYVIFFLMLYYISKAVTSLYPQEVEISLGESIVVGIIAAIIFGTALGVIDFFVEKKLRGKSIGIEILIKSVLYFSTWYLVGWIGYAIGKSMDAKLVESPLLNYTEFFAGYMFMASSIYTAFMIVIISFIKQMNKKLARAY